MGAQRRHREGACMSRKRVVIAGLGDSGVLTAIRLARRFDVVGISAKPALVSGQELGWRLSRPEEWARANWIPFDRFRALDRVRTVHGTLTGVDLDARTVAVRGDDGTTSHEQYDALVISTGVSNGFWRTPNLQSHNEIGDDLREAHTRLSDAESVIVIGGGAAAISSAAQVATTWPDKRRRPVLPRRARTAVAPPANLGEGAAAAQRGRRGAAPRPPSGDSRRFHVRRDHRRTRASGAPGSRRHRPMPSCGRSDGSGRTPTGCPPNFWTSRVSSGRHRSCRCPDTRPCSRWATSRPPIRFAARHATAGTGFSPHNIRAEFAGKPLRSYRAPKRRWGSVLGVQPNGLEVFTPKGQAFRFPAWSFDRVLMPVIVRWGIYRGVRENQPTSLAP